MIYPIYVYGSSVLKKEAEDISPDDPGLKQLINDMFETMYASSGVGLAAPQIGKNIRVFVIDVSIYGDENPECEGFKKAFINPEIFFESEEEILMNEGCLSVPGIHEDVYRPEKIGIRFLNENLEQEELEIDGFAARAIQHEYDHLSGILFTDKLNPLRKTLLRSKLSSMSKGKYKASYKTKVIK